MSKFNVKQPAAKVNIDNDNIPEGAPEVIAWRKARDIVYSLNSMSKRVLEMHPDFMYPQGAFTVHPSKRKARIQFVTSGPISDVSGSYLWFLCHHRGRTINYGISCYGDLLVEIWGRLVLSMKVGEAATELIAYLTDPDFMDENLNIFECESRSVDGILRYVRDQVSPKMRKQSHIPDKNSVRITTNGKHFVVEGESIGRRFSWTFSPRVNGWRVHFSTTLDSGEILIHHFPGVIRDLYEVLPFFTDEKYMENAMYSFIEPLAAEGGWDALNSEDY